MNVLTINLLFSTLVFWTAARLYLIPKLPALDQVPSSYRFSCCMLFGISA